jgi:hypothetical protein
VGVKRRKRSFRGEEGNGHRRKREAVTERRKKTKANHTSSASKRR